MEETFGASTKVKRTELGLEKTHANDAYSMGILHPKDIAPSRYFVKKRRNHRSLEMFYDAKYIDIRDGKVKKASELGCNRTTRSMPRNNENNLRKYRGKQQSKGKRVFTLKRYDIRSGATVIYEGNVYVAKTVHCNGKRVMLANGKSVALNKIKIQSLPGGWLEK